MKKSASYNMYCSDCFYSDRDHADWGVGCPAFFNQCSFFCSGSRLWHCCMKVGDGAFLKMPRPQFQIQKLNGSFQ